MLIKASNLAESVNRRGRYCMYADYALITAMGINRLLLLISGSTTLLYL
jgi:hypothetical protein